MGVRIVNTCSKKDFRLVCYEDRGCGGSRWEVTRTSTPSIPNDEVAAFELWGPAYLKVEFFNDRGMSKRKSWAEVKLTPRTRFKRVENMRFSSGIYVHHRIAGDDNIDGKVSAIRITDEGVEPD